MILAILSAALATILCSLAYRFGGCSKEEGKEKYPWAPEWLFRSWVRDCFCSLIPTIWALAFLPGAPWWCYLLSFGLGWATLSTYWDFLFGSDNYWVHGLMIGLAFAPVSIATGHWLGLIVRPLSLAVLMGGISAIFGSVDIEELGRGASIGATLPLAIL
jgi:hypothetical protein